MPGLRALPLAPPLQLLKSAKPELDSKEDAMEKDLFGLLEADHEKVSGLFTQLKSTQDPRSKRALFDQLRTELEIHSSAEELAVYPTLHTIEITEDLAEEAEAEHGEIRSCLDTVNGLDGEDENWDTAVLALERAVKHHVKEEESEIFDSMRDCFDQRQLDQMKREFLEAKQDMQEDKAA
jgi:hemerythrin superfamily protein